MKDALQFDLLKDPPVKILLSICIPLALVSILSCFTGSITNILYSRYAGEYFAVAGLISTVTTSLSMVMGGVISAAWIKTAVYYKNQVLHSCSFFANALYSILLTDLILIALCLLFKRQIFHLFHVPNELYATVSLYYTVSICSCIFTSVASFLIYCINGVGSVLEILIGNAISSCGTALAAALLLRLFDAGIAGAALVTPVCALAVIAYGTILLRKKGIPLRLHADNWKPDLRMIGGILKVGFLMGAQCLLCQIGDICIGLQTNRLLSLEYISVLSVTVPLTAVFSSFSSAVNAFVPINYRMGHMERVRNFMHALIVVAILYALLCTALYALLGNWYYATLFESAEAVVLGASYWKIYGLGMVPLAVIFVLRFFLDSIGYNKPAFLTGIFQMGGALVGAYVLIPLCGNTGRSLSTVLAYSVAALYLVAAYWAVSRKLCITNPD